MSDKGKQDLYFTVFGNYVFDVARCKEAIDRLNVDVASPGDFLSPDFKYKMTIEHLLIPTVSHSILIEFFCGCVGLNSTSKDEVSLYRNLKES